MVTNSRQAKNIALVSLVLSVLFFLITWLMGQWSGFFSVSAVSWIILSAVLIWAVLLLQFYQRKLAEQETLDAGQLIKDKADTAIFESQAEQANVFAVAQRRLRILEKYVLPILSAVIAAFQVTIGLYLLRAVQGSVPAEAKQPLVCAITVAAIAFFSFLISRYSTGMSTQAQWKPLRAGGSICFCAAALCFLLGIGLALAQFQIFIVVKIVDLVIPILLIILGAETAVNIILDIYRPRLKDRYERSAFDSRLLGLINEPGGFFKTAASAMDYQFGFKVSQTWFYKLLEKAIVPLVIFAAVVLYLMSCFVIVSPNEQAVIEHFGNPLDKDGNIRLVGPGLTVKLPWPVDIAYKYPTQKISEIYIGFVPKLDPKTNEPVREPLLWGKEHFEKEYSILVASLHVGQKPSAGTVPISLVKANIPVQYRIKDLYSFIYNHKDPERLLESICYRELTKFASSATIEVDEQVFLEQSLLGAGRAKAKEVLTQRIQAAADQAGLGVEIVFLGLQGIHPPPEVAEDYQKVIGAVQNKQAIILYAQAMRNSELGNLAGSVEDADELYHLAAQYELAKRENDFEKVKKLEQEIDRSFTSARGQIFSTLREAESYAFEKTTLAESTGLRFKDQIQAYNAAKDIYRQQQRLTVFEEGLQNIRKYVIVSDPNDSQVFIVDVQEKLSPSLYDLAGIEETSEK